MRRKPQVQYERILHEKNKNSRGGVHNLAVLFLTVVITLASVFTVSADTITITKKWDDGLTGVDAANRDAPKVVVTATMSRSEMLDLFYPVGCYFETTNGSFDPNTAWGGTWEKEPEGSALISGSASGTYRVGQNYGANSLSYTPAGSVGVTVNGHTLTIDEMPSHNHTITIVGNQSISTGGVRLQGQWGKGQPIGDNMYNTGGNQPHSHSASGSFSGTAATLNVMQKSKAVYIWHRTA